jgi:hypothetical protein
MGLPVIGEFVKNLINPVKDVIDEFHHSGEEKLEAQMVLFKLEQGMREKLLEYDAKIKDLQANIIMSEAKGQAWMQQNWRPLVMLIFGAIIANNYILAPWISVVAAVFGSDFRAPILEFPAQFWQLLVIGVGGYIAGRTIEKTKQQWSVNIGKGKLERTSSVDSEKES